MSGDLVVIPDLYLYSNTGAGGIGRFHPVHQIFNAPQIAMAIQNFPALIGVLNQMKHVNSLVCGRRRSLVVLPL